MDSVSRELLAAQNKAEALFAEIVARGLVSAGKLESELTEEIHALAESRFGVRRGNVSASPRANARSASVAQAAEYVGKCAATSAGGSPVASAAAASSSAGR